MKKIGAFLLTFALLVGTMVPSALAASNSWKETQTIYSELGEIEIDTTTVVRNSVARSGGSVSRTATVKYSGKVIAEVTLSATFGYNGTVSWVIGSSSSHTTYDGWSYGSENITSSGGTVALSGILTHLLHGRLAVNISITCSPTGEIS